MITIHPLLGISEVTPGADMATLLLQAIGSSALQLQHGDILVVTQKIISKAQGRFVPLNNVEPGPEALRIAATTKKDARLVELVLSESREVVRAAPHVLITRHRLGFVMANAGIDRSNLGPGRSDDILLLPLDPDATALALRGDLVRRTGCGIGVVISDSFGRPWRMGVVAVAIGAAGIPALIDERGDPDRDGRRMEVTQVALADLVASAANLATGEGAEGIPAAVVRGVRLKLDAPIRDASALVRAAEEDLFR